jgi:hypothetical protein
LIANRKTSQTLTIAFAHEQYAKLKLRKGPSRKHGPQMTLYELEDIPACDEGMALTEKFMESCVRAIETVGSTSHLNERFADYKRNHAGCDKCNEV